jgi:uncharacterized protein YceK
MKKKVLLVLAASLLLTGCSNKTSSVSSTASSNGVSASSAITSSSEASSSSYSEVSSLPNSTDDSSSSSSLDSADDSSSSSEADDSSSDASSSSEDVSPLVSSSDPLSSFSAEDSYSSSDDISSSEVSSSSIDDADQTVPETLSDIASGISISTDGYLNDIAVGMSLAAHSSYPITFTITSDSSSVVNVRSDNENVLTAVSNASGSVWTIETHKQGYAHLIIEDGDEIIHFRKLVTVKKRLSEDEATASLADIDHFETIPAYEALTGSMSIVFMDDGKGYISGYESGGTTLSNDSFSYEYDGKYSSISENHDHWFIYKVSNWTVSDFVFSYFALWETGDRLHAHTSNALLGIFEPAEE